MSVIDWAAVVVYGLLMLGIGWYFSRKNKNVDEYLLADRKMSWWSVGLSLVATSVSATTFLGNPAESYQRDIAYLMFGFGSVLSLIVINYWFIPKILSTKVTSAYELLEVRFSRGIRLTAAIFYCLHLLLRVGVLLYGPSLVISQMLGISLWWAIGFMAVITIVYTWMGGFAAVIWTDVFQFVLLMGGGIFALCLLVWASGGFSEVWSIASAAGKTRLWDGTWSPTSSRNILSAVFVYSIFEMAIRGCDQQFVQRYISCGSTKAAQWSSVSSVLWGLIVAVVFFGIGLAMYVAIDVKHVYVLPAGIKPDAIFPWYILHAMPKGLAGLMIAGILAAAMSSLSSAISALTNTTMQDFWPHTPSVKEARFWVLMWGMAGVGAAVLAVLSKGSLLSKALYFTSLFTGPLLGLFICALFFPKVKTASLYIGVGTGMALLAFFTTPPFLSADVWKPIYAFSWPWNPLISLSGLMVGVGVSHYILKIIKK